MHPAYSKEMEGRWEREVKKIVVGVQWDEFAAEAPLHILEARSVLFLQSGKTKGSWIFFTIQSKKLLQHSYAEMYIVSGQSW